MIHIYWGKLHGVIDKLALVIDVQPKPDHLHSVNDTLPVFRQGCYCRLIFLLDTLSPFTERFTALLIAFRVQNALCRLISGRVIEHHAVNPVHNLMPVREGVGIYAFLTKHKVAVVAVNFIKVEVCGAHGTDDLFSALIGYFGDYIGLLNRKPIGCIFLSNSLLYFLQIVLSLPPACKFLGYIVIVDIVAIVEVIPDCPAVFAFHYGEPFIGRGSTLCGDFLRFLHHAVNALLRVGAVQSFADIGCIDIRKIVQLLLGEESILLNKLRDTALNLRPRQL